MAPSDVAICLLKIVPKTEKITPAENPKQIAVVQYLLAFFRSFAPSARLVMLPEPIPIVNPIA